MDLLNFSGLKRRTYYLDTIPLVFCNILYTFCGANDYDDYSFYFEVPFKKILIHGLIEDSEGKMLNQRATP